MKNQQRRRRRENQSTCTWDILVAVQWGNDDSAVSELLAVHGVGREETLKQGDGRIEHSGTLTTGLHSDANLLKVRELGGDLGDLGVTATGKVRVTEERSQLVGLILNDYIREGQQKKRCWIDVLTSPNGVLSVGPYL